MLTQVEMQVLDLVYRFCCKSVTIPFCWKSGRLSLKGNQNILYKYGLWLLLLSCLVLKTCMLFQKDDINEFIMSGIFFIATFANIVFQLTILFYQNELTQLINQILQMNSCWGNHKTLHSFFQVKQKAHSLYL